MASELKDCAVVHHSRNIEKENGYKDITLRYWKTEEKWGSNK